MTRDIDTNDTRSGPMTTIRTLAAAAAVTVALSVSPAAFGGESADAGRAAEKETISATPETIEALTVRLREVQRKDTRGVATEVLAWVESWLADARDHVSQRRKKRKHRQAARRDVERAALGLEVAEATIAWRAIVDELEAAERRAEEAEKKVRALREQIEGLERKLDAIEHEGENK